MTARTLVVVLLRVIGLYLLVTTAISLPSQIAFLMVPATDEYGGALMRASFIGSVVGIIGRALMGWALFFKTRVISELVVPEDSASAVISGGEQLYVAGVALVGTWILVEGMQDLAASGTVLFLLFEGEQRSFIFEREVQTVARGVMAVIAGSILIVGQDRVVKWWQSIRGM